MKPVSTLPILAVFAVAAWSCDHYTSWDKTVSNDSTHTLILYITEGGGGFNFSDSIILAPGTTETIYNFSDAVEDGSPACEQLITRLTLVPEAGFTITKDIQDGNNWTSNSAESKTGFAHSCLFSVTDDDID